MIILNKIEISTVSRAYPKSVAWPFKEVFAFPIPSLGFVEFTLQSLSNIYISLAVIQPSKEVN